MDLLEILLHRFHHQYSQIIAIHDRVMLNHPTERRMFCNDSVVVEWFVVVVMVDVNVYEVESVEQTQVGAMVMMDDNKIEAFSIQCFERQLNDEVYRAKVKNRSES